jgi:hypothetical protein
MGVPHTSTQPCHFTLPVETGATVERNFVPGVDSLISVDFLFKCKNGEFFLTKTKRRKVFIFPQESIFLNVKQNISYSV